MNIKKKGKCPECGHKRWKRHHKNPQVDGTVFLYSVDGLDNRRCTKCNAVHTVHEWMDEYKKELEYNTQFYDVKKDYSFNFKFKLKDCENIFKEGWEPGVLAMQVFTYKLSEDERKSPVFVQTLMDDYNTFIQNHLEEFVIEDL